MTPEPHMSLAAMQRVFGASNVSAVTERGQTVAYRVRIGERNMVLSPRDALARMTRLDSLAAKLRVRSRGIVNGVLVAVPDASSLVLRDVCGIPNCPNEGHRHADLSDASLARDVHRIRKAAAGLAGGRDTRGKYPKGSRAVSVPSLFCAAHGSLYTDGKCPQGCARD
jgi:hypothetical protein